jgi:hypothetical protein
VWLGWPEADGNALLCACGGKGDRRSMQWRRLLLQTRGQPHTRLDPPIVGRPCGRAIPWCPCAPPLHQCSVQAVSAAGWLVIVGAAGRVEQAGNKAGRGDMYQQQQQPLGKQIAGADFTTTGALHQPSAVYTQTHTCVHMEGPVRPNQMGPASVCQCVTAGMPMRSVECGADL